MGPGCLRSFPCHDDVIKWKHFPRSWSFVRGIHRSPVNSTHKGQWRGALMLSLICARINGLSKHWWGWWFETLSSPLWRHCNVCTKQHLRIIRLYRRWFCRESIATERRTFSTGRRHHKLGSKFYCLLAYTWVNVSLDNGFSTYWRQILSD